MDDYSRLTWLYMLHDRSEFLHVFQLFHHEVTNQFNTSLKILRTDNALEYTQKSISLFCSNLGIIHQTSCTYTPQQNGVAERKYRHLLEVARSLLFHMNVPKSFWSDSVLTAYYLINRVPSTILNH